MIQIQSFTAQLAQLSPGVSGKGYFKIGKKLIPAVSLFGYYTNLRSLDVYERVACKFS